MKSDFFQADDIPKYTKILTNILSGETMKPFEVRWSHQDGSVHWGEVQVSVIENDDIITGFQAIIRDITDSKHTFEKLCQSEMQFREFADSLPEAVFETNDQGVITYLNKAGFQWFGFSETDFAEGISALKLIIPEERQRAQRDVKCLYEGQNIGNTRYQSIRKDGSVVPVAIHLNVIVKENEPAGLRGVITDLTNLDHIERRFQLTAEVSNDLIYEWDIQSDILQWFGDIDEALGYEKGEIVQSIEGWLQLMHPEAVSYTHLTLPTN